MATCKDCVYHDICSENKAIKIEIYSNGFLKQPRLCEYVEHICNHFKNKADFIEVCRCKDCKKLKIINDGKVYAQCTETEFEFLPFGTDIEKHFCGYAERKAENG